MISSFMPMTFLLLPLELLLLLLVFDVFDELGDEVDALLFDAEFALEALLFALLLLLLELLLLPPAFEDPDDPPEDCFSFLSLIIIYTVADHLFINFYTLVKIGNFLLHLFILFAVFTPFQVSHI
jgi:hypothetical protein